MDLLKRTMARYRICTVGCKTNQFESAAVAEGLERQGLVRAEAGSDADLVIINSCSVTHRGDADSRRLARRARAENPEARIVLTGCYAQTQPKEASRVADLVVGNGEKARLPELVAEAARLHGGARSGRMNDRPAAGGKGSEHRVVVGDVFREPGADYPLIKRFPDRTRPFVKIQDGCDVFCAFCIVPHARGRSRSVSPEQVVRQVAALEEQGAREVVLTGIHIGSYGADLAPSTDLAALIRRVARKTGVSRIRLGSMEPSEVTRALREVFSDPDCRLAPHIHLCLQSGDDRVLRAMRRPYAMADFESVVKDLVRCCPGIGIGTDLIVGFPGEDEAAFRETLLAVERLPLAYFHLFPYSARRGTPAAKFRDRPEQVEVRRRMAKLREVAAEISDRFARAFVGETVEVLVEAKRDLDRGALRARAANYLAVYIEGPDTWANRLGQVRVERYAADRRLLGTPVGWEVS